MSNHHHHNTIDDVVRTSESEIKNGKIDAFAQQLASLPESERQQIATRIKQDFAKAGANSSLPELTFSDSGTLERYNTKDGQAETTYANNGHKVSEDFHRQDGKLDRREVYADNGKLQSRETTENGNSEISTYNDSNKLIYDERRNTAGDFHSEKFDSRGKLTEMMDIKGADRSGGTWIFDPNTERPMYSNTTDQFGYKIHQEYDSRTGKPSSWVGSAEDGTTAVANFDDAGNAINYHLLKR